MAGIRHKLQLEQEMDEDLILEIIARLPLKYVVQCSVLNKNIRRCFISHPDFLPHFSTIFYCSNHNPKIFTTIAWSRTVHPLRRSVTLNKFFSIKASCNGLLLLQLRESMDFLVFNPTTGGITDLGQGIIYGSIGFAVTNSGFKLVGLWHRRGLYFTVLVPGSRGGVVGRPQVSYKIGLRIDDLLGDREPVYANGNLYWLGKREGGKVTVAFDVEKEKGRVIAGPVVGNEVTKWWFGSAENSIYFVYSLASEMVILTLITDKWDVMHRVSKPREYDDDDEPLFFDGRRMLFVLRKRGEGADIYRYDLVMDVWEKIQSLESWKEGCKLKLFSYTSTFANVGSTYLNEKHVEIESRLHDLLLLQKLLTPADDIPICGPAKSLQNKQVSPNTRPPQRQYAIKECLEVLDKIAGIEEGDEMWLFATDLFMDPSIRELFLSIKKDETRLTWLKKQIEKDKIKNARFYHSDQ